MADTVQNAKDAAYNVADKARQAASGVADKARDVASTAGSKADQAFGKVGEGLKSAAGTLREHAPEGMLGSATNRVADTLDSSGRYLQDEGLTGIVGDLGNLIRRNPVPALLIGLGIGFLIARSLRS
jgi:hypothetical protein